MMLYDWLREINFAQPLVFPLFALVPILIYLYIKKHGQMTATTKVSSVFPFAVVTTKNYLRHLPFVFRVLAISCLILALARPQKRNDQQKIQGEGIDIILCMDVSGSMGSRDIQPSRLEAAKRVAEQFIRSRPVDRIGVVIFSGEAFTQSPLTTDRNRRWIPQIETMLAAPETTLVVVGAAHLVGRDGVVEMLRRKGYVVEQL